MSFKDQLTLTIIDKAIIGTFLAFTAFLFNKILEAFRLNQAKELEVFKFAQVQQLETFKNQLVNKDDAAKSIRLAVADLSRKIASGIHSISWLTWSAKYNPQHFSLINLDEYDKEMHILLGDLVAAHVVLGALDSYKQKALTVIVDKFYELDANIGLAKARYLASPQDGIQLLSNLHGAPTSLAKELFSIVSGLFKQD